MKWLQVFFEKEEDVKNKKEKIRLLLFGEEYAFLDREYEIKHRIRMRGIRKNEDEVRKILGDDVALCFVEENPNLFFQNLEQFILYCKIHHELDQFWFPYYFTDSLPLELLVANAKIMAKDLTVLKDEGYNSHLSHFWGFFHSLSTFQKEGVLQLFHERYTQLRELPGERMLHLPCYLENIDGLVKEGKMDFYSPQSLQLCLETKKFASKLHESAAQNAEQSEFLHSKHYICNRWYLNALYVSMILMNISVADRFFLNYVIAMEKYPVDEICKEFLQTGEEKIWLRENYA